MPILLAILGLAGLFTFARTSVAGVVEVHAGETWQLTIRAVGSKVSQAQADALKTQMSSLGTVESLLVNDAWDTIVAVIHYTTDTHILLNQLIALTTDPGRGLMITDAIHEKESGAAESLPNPAYATKYRLQVYRWAATPNWSAPVMMCDYLPVEALEYPDLATAQANLPSFRSRYEAPPTVIVKLLKLYFDPATYKPLPGDVLYETAGPRNTPGPCG